MAPTQAEFDRAEREIEKLKITDAPGPDADASDLRTHYRRVQEILACRSYDLVTQLCHWCIAWEPLTHAKAGTRGGARMFCSGRCAGAYVAYSNYRNATVQVPTGRFAAPNTTPAPSDGDEAANEPRMSPPRRRETPEPMVGGSNGGVVPDEEIENREEQEPPSLAAASVASECQTEQLARMRDKTA